MNDFSDVNTLQIIFLILLGAKTAASVALDALNRRESVRNAHAVPAVFRDSVDPETYRKSVAYTLRKIDFGYIETLFGAVLSLVLVIAVFAPLFDFAGTLFGLTNDLSGWARIWREGAILIGISVVIGLLDLPFDWYENFRLEAQFGFNKTTPALWISDKLKGIVLGIVLGMPLLWAIFAFYYAFPQTWWIWAQCLFIAFQLLLLVLFPKLILPLFNKLSPLPEGELRDALGALAERCGFVAKKIEIIDGSKRSGHSNAYFTGFGKWRRIVLFDTLVEQLSTQEIEAVLAHEIGHSKRGHIAKRLVVSSLIGLVAFAIIGWLLGQEQFFTAFGFKFTPGLMLVPAFLLLSQIAPLITFWISPLSNHFSRKHEYEADAFAKQAEGSPEPLISALRKLHEKNLGNLTPHPIYSAFFYSHPTLAEREHALRQTPTEARSDA